MTEQTNPVVNDNASIHDLVVDDIMTEPWFLTATARSNLIAEVLARKELGVEQYGTVLQAGNGRNVGQDALEEALDLVVYVRQGVEEGHEGFYYLYFKLMRWLIEARPIFSSVGKNDVG